MRSHLQLLSIMEIVFAPKLTTLIPLLSELIKDFLYYFKELFPDINYINKMLRVRVNETLSYRDLNDINFLDIDLVFKTKSIRVDGIKYAVGLFICLNAKGNENVNLPIF